MCLNKHKTIQKFTLLTVLLSNVLSISISSFTVYLVTKSHDRPDSSGYQDTHQGLPGIHMDGIHKEKGLPGIHKDGIHKEQGLPGIRMDGIQKDEVQQTTSNHKKGQKTRYGVMRGTNYGVVHIDLGQNTTKDQDSEEEWWND